MKTVTVRHRIIIERENALAADDAAPTLSESRTAELRENNISTVFIVTTAAVEIDRYLNIVHGYQNSGFTVKSIHLERLEDSLPALRSSLLEIVQSLHRGNAIIIPYGRSISGIITAGLLIMKGKSAEDAIDFVREMDERLLSENGEISFLYDLQGFLRSHHGALSETENLKNLLVSYNGTLFSTDPETSDIKDAIPKTPAEPPRQAAAVERPAAVEEIAAPEPDMRATTDERQEAVEESAAPKPAAREKALEREEEERAEPAPIFLEEEEEVEIVLPTEEGAEEQPEERFEPVVEKELAEEAVEEEKEKPLEERPAITEEVLKEAEALKTEALEEKQPAKAPAEKERAAHGEEPEESVDKRTAGRKTPFSSIRFKLISIISLIIVLSISGMIFVATYFFKQDNEIRVQENNLKLSEVTALKVRSDIESIIKDSRIIAETLSGNAGKASISALFKEATDFIFIGIGIRRGDALTLTRAFYNTPLLRENGISESDIANSLSGYSAVFSRSLNGEQIIHNVSQAFKIPIVGIGTPFQRDAAGNVKSVIMSYYKLDSMLKAFKSSGITTVFLVNDAGDIIAHPDSTLVVSGGNYLTVPIVKMMMKSKIDNGQTRYLDENGIPHLGSFKKLGLCGCGIIATVEEEKAFQEVYNIQRRNLYLMAIMLTAAVLVVFFFGQTITNPIIRLVSATKRIKEGQFRVDIKPSSKDEIGDLTSSFIEMGKGLEEREKIKTAFGKFVNPALAEAVLRDEVKLGGERKSVAVLFSDIRSFTELSERMQPEEVVGMLNAYMSRMVDCIDKAGGVVDKFIGDAIMAIWGAPISTDNDTERAVDGALLMRKVMIEYNTTRGSPNRPKLKFGIAINTGPVLVGQIGTENRMEYTVIGDTVNLASRIEALNKPFGTDILIGEDTYELVRDIYAVEEMPSIRVKGKEKPQKIYAVLGRLDDPEHPKSLEDLKELWGVDLHESVHRKDDLDSEDRKYEIL
jgi:adenylate cyclase